MSPGSFESDDVENACLVPHRTKKKQYGGTMCWPSFSIVNPDTFGCVWIGEFDLNALHVNREIFESEKKQLRIQNIRIQTRALVFHICHLSVFVAWLHYGVFPRLRNNVWRTIKDIITVNVMSNKRSFSSTFCNITCYNINNFFLHMIWFLLLPTEV